MSFFAIDNIAFEVWGYAISYVELIATCFGIISVYLASRANILTWPSGIVNEVFLFILFFQIQLYADVFLQIYFFVVTLYGWYHWRQKSSENSVSTISRSNRFLLVGVIVVGTLIAGYLMKNIHLYFPDLFALPADYPFVDSFIMVGSIVATVLLARKKIENWYLWFAVDVVCVFLYFVKEVYFLSLEYVIFLVLVLWGLYHWQKQLKNG